MQTTEKRGNISVPDGILRKIKAQAASRGQSIRELVEPVLNALAEGKLKPEELAAR